MTDRPSRAHAQDDERSEFEKWRRQTTSKMSQDAAVAREGFGDDADYASRATRAMWIGWKGRAAAPSAQDHGYKAGLAAQAPQAAEPVAWWRWSYIEEDGSKDADVQIGKEKPSEQMLPPNGFDWSPLYIAPHAPAAQPLTEDEIMQLFREHTWFNGSHAMTNYVPLVRAVEARCGIAPPAHGEQHG